MSDYVSFNGSQDAVLKFTTALHFTRDDPLSMTVRFRTSQSASRQVIWCDKDNTAGREYYLDMSHAGAGAGVLRFVGYDGGSNFFTPNNGSSKADGNWHVVTCVRETSTLHRWFLDGAQVGSDISTPDIGTSSNSHVRELGSYPGSLPFTGDINWIVFHAKAISLAEHQSMNSGGSPLDISATLNYYPCGPASAASWGHDHLSLQMIADNQAVRQPTTDSSFPTATADGGPAFLTATYTGMRMVLRTSRLIQPGAASSSDEVIREIGNVYTADDGDLVLLYTGHPASTPAHTQIHYATSSNGGSSWTKQGVMLSQATHGIYTEDPHGMFDGTEYWITCENKSASGGTTAGCALFSSANGKTSWTLESSNFVPFGGSGAWDEADTSSPIMHFSGGTYYALYEGRTVGAGDNGRVGLTTASDPRGTWTKDAGNPVLSFSGVAGSWFEDSIVPDDVVEASPKLLLVHAADGSGNYRCGVFEGSSWTSWAEGSGHKNPLTGVLCNTLMLAGYGSGQIVGVDESGTNQYSILGYTAYAPTVVGTKARPPRRSPIRFFRRSA